MQLKLVQAVFLSVLAGSVSATKRAPTPGELDPRGDSGCFYL